GMNFEAEAPRELRAVADALPLGLRRRHAIVGQRIAPSAGVNLDHRRADRDRRLGLPRLGGDEQRNADAGPPQSGHDRGERVVLAGDIEAAFGRALFAPLGDETGRVRAGVDGDAHHLLGCRHFEIERLCDVRLEACDIVVADVPAILAQMRGDAISAGFDRNLRRMHGIRVSSPAGIADGGDVVDVDAETKVWSRHSCNRSYRQRPIYRPWGCALSALSRSPPATSPQAFTRSAFATTSFARNCAIIELRCLRSKTSRSMVTEVKSGDERSMLILSILPSCSAMIWAT